ncbi:heme-copper oxidase subunit III [Terriglobus sp. RCC_193]|uniref:cytochrome c oxidase subunit 3 n=1 Tax=Terriglobus sp. RCC_193 TaxID=3239218 RepID=UPI003523301E
MPTILHPDEVVEKLPPRRPDEADIGGGRLPPIEPKHTGGGGDGDNWSNNPVGHRGPRERLQTYRFAVFSFLAGDLIFFMTLVSAFFVTKHAAHIDAYNHYVRIWIPITIPSILWLNTAVLLISSVTIEFARRSVFHEIDVMEEWLGLGSPTRRKALPWLIATTLLGAAFVWGQIVAWRQLAVQHIFYSGNPSSRFFYLITGVHGIHLILGILMLVTAIVGLRSLKSIQSRQIMVDSTSWYWHAMGILWIFLFALLLWGQ